MVHCGASRRSVALGVAVKMLKTRHKKILAAAPSRGIGRLKQAEQVAVILLPQIPVKAVS
jgi:hypothetical protein